MAQLTFTRTTVGKTATALLNEFRPEGQRRFEAVLTATPGQVASVNCRPLAAESEGHPGFLIGGEVTISGTADANGLVGADGLPFLSTFPRYGFEVVSISGAGASVVGKVGA
jgi:hypothetical protein